MRLPWYTYGLWLLREEAPIFILAAIGTVVAMVRRRNRFAVFAGIWAFVLLAAYSFDSLQDSVDPAQHHCADEHRGRGRDTDTAGSLRRASRRKTGSSFSGRSVRGSHWQSASINRCN